MLIVSAQIGKMRYATVNEFRGRKMVNIREFYEADGELRPGKKGWYSVTSSSWITFLL